MILLGATTEEDIKKALFAWYDATEMLHYYCGYNLIDIYNMLPYEVDLYIAKFIEHKKQEKEEQDKLKRK